MSAGLIAYTGTVLAIGYLIIVAVFAVGYRAGRFAERVKRGAA